MNIEVHIAQLLHLHDCVIVPGLGGFVANYKPAYIQPMQHTFHPPSKGISFNKNLQNNDGLLANFVAQKEGVDYNQACTLISTFVAGIQNDLKNEQQKEIKGVGRLFLDQEKRLRFEPSLAVNYLLSSYGLTVFHKQPVVRERIEDKITKEFVDRAGPLVAEKSRSKKWLVAAAITIPLAFFAIWIPTKYDLGADINYAELNPFTPDFPAKYSPHNNLNTFYTDDDKSLKEQLLSAGESSETVTVDIDGISIVVRLKDHVVADPVSTYVATEHQRLNFHIVGGCFSSKKNAKKMVRKLKQEGFNASIIGKRKGLWTVSYNSFATRKEAVRGLALAKAHNDKAWILNY